MQKGLVMMDNLRNEAGLHEYRLVIQPGPAVMHKIKTEQELFKACYGIRQQDLTAETHLHLCAFSAKPAMEETLLRFMRRIFIRQPSILSALNNFGGRPAHSIYFRIQDQRPFRQVISELQPIHDYLKSCDCPGLISTANLGIELVSGLRNEVYQKAMYDYSLRLFHEPLDVTELILKKRVSRFDEWKTIHVFPLQPLIIQAA